MLLSLIVIFFCGWQITTNKESDKASLTALATGVLGWWCPSPKDDDMSDYPDYDNKSDYPNYDNKPYYPSDDDKSGNQPNKLDAVLAWLRRRN